MIRQWHDPASVAALFQDWDETMIRSCLQQLMGTLYVAEPDAPASVCAQLGCFAFYAGRPNAALLQARPKGFAVLTPQNEAWDRLIGQQLPEARHVTRYAMRKDTRFDRKKLRALASQLPAGYLLRRIDGALYTQCLADPATADFVSAFDSRAHYSAGSTARFIHSVLPTRPPPILSPPLTAARTISNTDAAWSSSRAAGSSPARRPTADTARASRSRSTP